MYYQSFSFEFINYDTPEYVYDNMNVKKGLTADNIAWAFSTITCSNWHPLTWISHMSDVELFGMRPGAHHAVNVVFHTINSLILYMIIRKLAGSLWSAGFIATLFAVHPLHVQSVVWIAERKDVLCTMFGFTSILSYCFYVEKQQRIYYMLVFLLLLLSLLSKPMLVTLPFILLLLDYWPLNRFAPHFSASCKILVEKIPLFLLSVTSCAITFYAQQSGGAVSDFNAIPLGLRFLNMAVSYVKYIFFMFYPVELAVIYPYPENISFYPALFSILFLLMVSFLALWNFKKSPWLFTGWFFFLGTIFPVIGIIQVGAQAMADRYTYVPFIGLFLIVARLIDFLLKKLNTNKTIQWLLSCLLIAFCSALSYHQVSYWHDSISLFSRAIEVTENNYIAHNNLGYAFLDRKEYVDAGEHFFKAININPEFAVAHLNYGVVLAKQNEFEEAIKHYQAALKIKPDYQEAYVNIGNLYYNKNQYKDALRYYLIALKLYPLNVGALNGIGAVMVKTGHMKKGVDFFHRVLEIRPDDLSANSNLKRISAALKSE